MQFYKSGDSGNDKKNINFVNHYSSSTVSGIAFMDKTDTSFLCESI